MHSGDEFKIHKLHIVENNRFLPTHSCSLGHTLTVEHILNYMYNIEVGFGW